MTAPRIASTVYGVLLRTLPRDFRARNAAELRAVFDQIMESDGGRTTRVMREYADILQLAVTMRFAQARRFVEMMSFRTLASVSRDALSGLRRAPRFSIAAIATLGLGIGAVAAIFNLAYGLWLKPLPFNDPARLVSIRASFQGFGATISAPEAQDYRAVPSITQLATYHYGAFITDAGGEPHRVVAYSVEPSLFPLLGVKPVMGRGFSADDVDAGTTPVILSDRLWTSMFNRDAHVVGRRLQIRGGEVEVIGVMPAGFSFPFNLPADAWLPMSLARASSDRNMRMLDAVARMRPGVSIEQAQSELAVVAARNAVAFPESSRGWTVRASSIVEDTIGPFRNAFAVLLGMVGLLMCIAGANVTGLFVARDVSKRHDFAVRLAIGATPWRLRALVMTETVMLAVAGGVVGTCTAQLLTSQLTAMLPPNTPRIHDVRLNTTVIAVAMIVAVVSGIVSGWASGRGLRSMTATIREGRTTGLRRARMRHGLIVAEVALSLVLLIAAGLMVRTFSDMIERDHGFNPSNLLTLHLSLPFDRYTDDNVRLNAFADANAALRGIRGVMDVGMVTGYPQSALGIAGGGPVQAMPRDGSRTVSSLLRIADGGYFRTMGTRMAAGRAFNRDDRANTDAVAIVNETVAKALWPGESAVGKMMKLPPGPGVSPASEVRVVGVAADMRTGEAASADVFTPLSQAGFFWTDVVIRTSVDPETLANDVTRTLHDLDRQFLVEEVAPMTRIMSNQLALERTQRSLATLFGVLAAVLTAIGLYGLLANVVSQQVQEIGIRRALGAQSSAVFMGVLRRALALWLAGSLIGAVAIVLIRRTLAGFIFGMSDLNPVVLGGAGVLLLGITLAACALPARRALKVDPLTAIR